MMTMQPVLHQLLQANGRKKIFQSDEVILEYGATIRHVPILISGTVKVLRNDEDGREILLYYIMPGESCIMSFLAGTCNGTSQVKAVAEERSELLMLPIDKAMAWTREFADWNQFVFQLYQQRFEELLDVINAIAFKKMDERLLDYLHKKARVLQSNELFITHEQIANDLGTARVVVSRLLKQLEQEKGIKMGRNKIQLL
jgi:CRP/FNR family transcriptional regulator